MRGKMDCYGLTDQGRVRQSNEDQFLIADLNKSMRVHQTSLDLDHRTRVFGNSQGQLLLVADGMGGAAAGERASQFAVDRITRYILNTMDWFFRLDERHEHEFLDELRSAVESCQTGLRDEGQQVPGRQGMGTTLTMAYMIWPRLFVVHVGDSRCYLHRGGQLNLITHDQTIAQQLVDEGALDPAQAQKSPWSHRLWNVLGGDRNAVHADLYKAELQLGDTVLLCTDGLTRHLADDQINRALNRSAGARETAEGLVQAANQAGGQDNITVVVARFLDLDQPRLAARAEVEIEHPVAEPAGPGSSTTTRTRHARPPAPV